MPETYNSPYAYNDKLSSLEQAKEKKLTTLSDAPYEEAMLESLYDVDSPRFVGVTGGLGGTTDDGITYDRTDQLTADRLKGIDSYEVFPRSEYTKNYLYTDPRGIAKMDRQRAKLAQARNVDVDTITNEDVFEEGAKGTLKELALLQAYSTGDEEYIQQVRDWVPSPEVTKQWRTVSPSFGSPEKPLNIPVDRAVLGEYGYYGRPLTQVRGKGSEYLLGEEGAGYKYYEDSAPTRILPTEEEIAQLYQQSLADNADFGDRLSNTASAFASSLVNELFVRPTEAVGDLTGLYDISGATKDVEDFFGYNPVMEQRAMEEIGKQWETIMSDEASTADKVRAAMKGMATAFTTPEMGGTSFGVIAAWAAPGALLGKLGVGTKYAAKIASIDQKVKAGELTANAARLQKLKAFRSVEGSADLLRKQSGHIVAAVGNVNDQYNEFVENNNGVELEGTEKTKWFSNRLAVQLVNQNLDKMVALDVIKSPGLIKSIVPIAKSMTNKEFSNVAKQAAKGVLVSSKGVAEESAQEYTQTMMELFNSRYGSEMFKDQDTFKEFLADKRNLTEAGVAALAGAGGAGQFEVVGGIAPVTGALMQGVGQVAGKSINAFRKGETETEVEPETPEYDAQVASAVQAHKERAATGSNPASVYFSSFGAEDAETRTAATQMAAQIREEVLSGTHSVFASDATPEEKIKQVKPLVTMIAAEDENLTVDEVVSAIEKQIDLTPEQKTTLQEEVTQAHKVGQQFASIKPMAEVAEEVSTGSRGFVTYAAQAFAAQAEGDDAGYESALSELDRFYTHQTTKLGRVRQGVQELKDVATAKANELVRQKKAPDLQTAFEQLRKKEGDKADAAIAKKREPDGKRIYHNDKKSGSTLVSNLDIYRQLATPAYDGGVFKWLNQVQGEVDAMGKVYSSLIEAIDTPQQTTEEVTPTTEGEIPVKGTEGEIPDGSIDDADTPSSAEELLDEGALPIPEAPPLSTDEEIFAEGVPAPLTDTEMFEEPAPEEHLEEAFTESAPATEEDFNEPVPDDFTESAPEEEFSAEPEEDLFPESGKGKKKPTRKKAEKEATVKRFIELRQEIKERRRELESEGKTSKDDLLNDTKLQALLEEKTSFVNVFQTAFLEKAKYFVDKGLNVVFNLYLPFTGGKGKAVTATLDNLVDGYVATGYTLSPRTENDVMESTKRFAARLRKAMRENTNLDTVGNYYRNPFLALMYDVEGKINYNVMEAAQAAVYEYLVQEASDLRSVYRTDEEISEVTGVSEDKLPERLAEELRQGGVPLKIAAAAVGDKLIKNLGMQIKTVKNREALASALGIAALQGIEGESIENYKFVPATKAEKDAVLAQEVPYIRGTSKMLGGMEQVRDDILTFEEMLGVEIDKERTYRTTPKKNAPVNVHRVPFQEAPKDHQEVVNRLANTEFSFNSGHAVLLRLFEGENGKLDKEALIEHIIGSEEDTLSNFDRHEQYKAQREAITRSIESYEQAREDIGDGSLFFNWFIAKNHRIHLDSNKINPQNDKHLSRWLLTTNTSKKTISKEAIAKAVNDGKTKNKEVLMFLYGIVQAFDGVGSIDLPGVDKDDETAIIKAAKGLLEADSDDLHQWAKEAAHIGHAALAIANIERYNNVDGKKSFSSDMVLEVDGLTNGFAFRSLQFPVQDADASVQPAEWLSKTGFMLEFTTAKDGTQEKSELYEMESMNEARSLKQEDVYISVGTVFNKAVVTQQETVSEPNQKNWITFLKGIDGGLPDFSEDSPMVRKFVRNLMKSPVMIFNYAAGIGSITQGLVDDQIMGTNYMSGKGLIDLLTAKKRDEKTGKLTKEYVVTQADLLKAFGEEKGVIYDKARRKLAEKSLHKGGDYDINILRNDLYKTVGYLYSDPLKTTLENLFGKQTAINKSLTNAAQFMYDYFKRQYDYWREHPDNANATEEDKIEFLKKMASVVPGVAAASSDDQLNKITFLKNALEKTNNSVWTQVPEKGMFKVNTVSRGFADPGVGPAVLTVLSLDSSVMAKTLNESYQGKKFAGALPIHDAIVLGIEEMGVIESYNNNFYTTNRNYSIIQEFVNAIDQFAELDGIKDQNPTIETNEGTLSFTDMRRALRRQNDEVQAARKELFKQNVKVGQMVGPRGSMAVINLEDATKESANYISKQANRISNLLKDEKLKNALGKEKYAKVVKKLETLIARCK